MSQNGASRHFGAFVQVQKHLSWKKSLVAVFYLFCFSFQDLKAGDRNTTYANFNLVLYFLEYIGKFSLFLSSQILHINLVTTAIVDREMVFSLHWCYHYKWCKLGLGLLSNVMIPLLQTLSDILSQVFLEVYGRLSLRHFIFLLFYCV